MAVDDQQPSTPTTPADDDEEDARWLAVLLAALQVEIAAQGYVEAAAVLTGAISGARAVVDGAKPSDGGSGQQNPGTAMDCE